MGGEPFPGSVIDEALAEDDFTVGGLTARVPAAAAMSLAALHAVASEHLYPYLPQDPDRLDIGPMFDCSKWCPADADVVADGVLIEVKTRMGRKQRNGEHADALGALDLNQMLGYLLFDTTNRYEIHTVGFYSGRYGNLVTFEVDEFLSNLAGGSVDLAEERAHIARVLRT